MDNRKLIVVKEAGGHTFTNILIADNKSGDHIAICQASDPPTFSQNNAAELMRRWNAYPELVTALADMVATAKQVEGMMDGDKDKQEAWTEELGRLYVALDAAKALLATLNTL